LYNNHATAFESFVGIMHLCWSAGSCTCQTESNQTTTTINSFKTVL